MANKYIVNIYLTNGVKYFFPYERVGDEWFDLYGELDIVANGEWELVNILKNKYKDAKEIELFSLCASGKWED